MNARERFSRVMHYQPVDRLPLWSVESVTEGAIRRWVRDGVFPLGMALKDVIKLDPKEIIKLDTDPLPAFVSRKVDEDERWRIAIDEYGFTVKTLKEQSIGPEIYSYLAGVVSCREDWNALKRRYDPADPLRKPRAWGPELIEYYNHASGPVGLRIDWGPGRGVKNGYAMGLERFLETLVDDPGLVRDMLEFWADFVIATASDWVTQVKFDFVFFTEDGMGYKNSSLVSPQTYRTIWVPPMRRVIDFLHRHDIDIIAYYSSGNLIPILPALMDIGVNLCFPLEVAAGMDAADLRRRFGKELRLIGNISRQALMDGPEAVEREFYAKVPELASQGGYIPAVDDVIMPDIAFESYKRFIDLVGVFQPTGGQTQ